MSTLYLWGMCSLEYLFKDPNFIRSSIAFPPYRTRDYMLPKMEKYHLSDNDYILKCAHHSYYYFIQEKSFLTYFSSNEKFNCEDNLKNRLNKVFSLYYKLAEARNHLTSSHLNDVINFDADTINRIIERVFFNLSGLTIEDIRLLNSYNYLPYEKSNK